MTVPAAVEERIADAPLSAHLATSVDDRPHVAPVWYVYDPGGRIGESAGDQSRESLWVMTGGKKLANVRENPRVAVSIERAEGPAVDWAVQLLGTAHVVDDETLAAAVESRLDEIYRDGEEGGDNEIETACLRIGIGSATAQQY